MTLSGSPREILAKLIAIKAKVEMRKAYGWEPFQGDEVWDYHTQEDSRVCPKCAELGYLQLFDGGDIKSTLPDSELSRGFEARPNTHRTYPEFHGECRCWMNLLYPSTTLAQRLAGEIDAL